jgi:hypothetical protein
LPNVNAPPQMFVIVATNPHDVRRQLTDDPNTRYNACLSADRSRNYFVASGSIRQPILKMHLSRAFAKLAVNATYVRPSRF